MVGNALMYSYLLDPYYIGTRCLNKVSNSCTVTCIRDVGRSDTAYVIVLFLHEASVLFAGRRKHVSTYLGGD